MLQPSPKKGLIIIIPLAFHVLNSYTPVDSIIPYPYIIMFIDTFS